MYDVTQLPTAPPSAHPGAIGELVGGQRLLAKLGAGGMGVVYRARDEMLGRLTAVKMLHPELSRDKEIVGRFFNEARAAAALRHIGIIEVYSFGYHTNGVAFLVMEYLEGQSLEARLAERGTLPHDEALRIIRDVCSALAAAHEQRIIHRDLKPDNIHLLPDPDFPGGERIKLLDFGVAKLAPESAHGVETRAGTVLGTPDYMAPEQCRGAAVDTRADLYALGAILFRMLCGRPPFIGEGVGEILVAQIRNTPPRPRDFDPSISPELEALVLKLLAKNPDDRFPSARALRRAIDALTGTAGPRTRLPAGTPPPFLAAPPPFAPVASPRPTTGPPTPRPVAELAPEMARPRTSSIALRLSSGPFYLVSALAVLGVIAGIIAATHDGTEPREPATAQQRCEAGDAPTCIELARAHELGGDSELDYDRAAGLYTRACESGSAEACARIGHYTINAIGVDRDEPRARELLRRGCTDEHTGGCADLGLSLVGNAAGAVDYIERGCAGGDADACLQKVRLLPVPAEEEAALREKAKVIAGERCDAGDASACSTMVQALTHETPQAEREALAAKACNRDQPIGCSAHPLHRARWASLMDAACWAGNGQMCFYLGQAYLEGEGVGKDPALAIEPLWRACRRRYPKACVALWRVHRADNSVGVDSNRLDRACDLDPASCLVRALDVGVASDSAAALGLLDRGCQGGSGEACVIAADLLSRGTPQVAKDEEAARRLRQRWRELQSRECSGDVVAGCRGLGDYYRTTGSVDRAMQSYDRACAARDERACEALLHLRRSH